MESILKKLEAEKSEATEKSLSAGWEGRLEAAAYHKGRADAIQAAIDLLARDTKEVR